MLCTDPLPLVVGPLLVGRVAAAGPVVAPVVVVSAVPGAAAALPPLVPRVSPVSVPL